MNNKKLLLEFDAVWKYAPSEYIGCNEDTILSVDNRLSYKENARQIKLKEKKNKNKYKLHVCRLTELVVDQLDNIDKRRFKHYDVDHKISINYGYKHNIPAKHIAHISNLRIIEHRENYIKNTKIFVDEENQWIIDNQGVS